MNYVTEERESQREKNNNGFDAPPRNEIIVIESSFSHFNPLSLAHPGDGESPTFCRTALV